MKIFIVKEYIGYQGFTLRTQGSFFVKAKSHAGKKTVLSDSTKQFELYSNYLNKTYVKSFSKQDWQ